MEIFEIKKASEEMSSNLIQQTIKGYQEFIGQYPFNFFLTLTFRSRIALEKAEKKIRIFLSPISRLYKIRLGALIFFVKKTREDNFHIHSFLIVDGTFRKNLDLTDFETFFLKYLSRHWEARQCSLKVLNEGTIPIYAKYVFEEKKNISLRYKDNYAMEFYRPNLLKRLRSSQGSLISFPLGEKEISRDQEDSEHT